MPIFWKMYFSLMPEPIKIRLNSLNELFKFIAGHVVINQRRIAHFFDGAVIVIVVTEFITGTDHFHAQIFIGTDHMTWTQAADIQHHAFALQTWFVFGDNRIVFGPDIWR